MSAAKQLSFFEVNKFFAGLSVQHPALEKVMKLIEVKLHQEGVQLEVNNILIVGESRSGKSHVIEQLLLKYPENIDQDRRVIPVLRADLTGTKAAVGGMYKRLLMQLHGSEKELKGRIEDQLQSVIRRSKLAQTRLIVIDEFQHVIGKMAKLEGIANALKDFMNSSKIPMLFCGTPDCLRLLDEDEQINNRVSQVVAFNPFPSPVDEPDGDFFQFIFSLDEALENLLGRRSMLMQAEFLHRIYAAARGKAGLAALLVKSAAKVCLVAGRQEIEMGDFEVALETDCGFLKRSDSHVFRASLAEVLKLPREPSFQARTRESSKDIRMSGRTKTTTLAEKLRG